MDSQAVKDKIQSDLASGNRYGIDSTPTFFLNGKKVEVATLEEFRNLLKSL